MIQVSIEVLFLAYLAVAITIIGVAWLRARIKTARIERQEVAHRLRCSLCATSFEDESSSMLARCPHCGTLNERERLRSL